MRTAKCVIQWVCLLVLVPSLVALGGQFQFTIPVVASNGTSGLMAVYGCSIESAALDGVIGSEWDDAESQELELGEYDAKVFTKHDGSYFYVAMIIYTNRSFVRGFEAFVVFDNGDGREYSTGDDMIVARAEDGQLVDADYYYRGTYDFRLDPENNAFGAGRYDIEGRCYVFEFARELASGDARDIGISPEDTVSTVYGWASY